MDSIDYKQHPFEGHHSKSAARGSFQGVKVHLSSKLVE